MDGERVSVGALRAVCGAVRTAATDVNMSQ